MFAVLINLSARKENLHFDVFKLKIQFINFKASLFTSFQFRMETERNVTEKKQPQNWGRFLNSSLCLPRITYILYRKWR